MKAREEVGDAGSVMFILQQDNYDLHLTHEPLSTPV